MHPEGAFKTTFGPEGPPYIDQQNHETPGSLQKCSVLSNQPNQWAVNAALHTVAMSCNTCSTSLELMCLVSCWLFPPLILNTIKQVNTEQQPWLLELSNKEYTCNRLISLEKINCWRHRSPKLNSSPYNNQRFLQKIKNS